MRTIQRFAPKLAVTALALALMSLATQAMAQTTVLSAKVVRLRGQARYAVDGRTWQPLHNGDVLKPGAVIQTAEKSFVDIQLGQRGMLGAGAGGSGPAPIVNNGTLYQPEEQSANVVRIFESSYLAIDKLTTQSTGMETVEETQLDLRAGKIMGNVKKLSNNSKYEVKIPNGVAGIRGTIYMISSSGVVNVLAGSVVIAVVGSDGSVATKVVTTGYRYDAMTQALLPIPPLEIKQLMIIYTELNLPATPPPQTYVKNPTILYVTPLDQGDQNQNGNSQGP